MYSALSTYENDNKVADIENSITETLLSNQQVERNCCRRYAYHVFLMGFLGFLTLASLACIIFIKCYF
jgi:hypothetical protein